MSYSLTINGKQQTVAVAADTPLLWVVRDTLNLKATKFGCGVGLCGACTVHINGVATRSCITKIQNVKGPVTTLEALSADGSHPVQRAWLETNVAQCGYCQPGQMMSAAALLSKNAKPTDKDIDTAMNGNLCRCGTYLRIRRAVRLAAKLAADHSTRPAETASAK